MDLGRSRELIRDASDEQRIERCGNGQSESPATDREDQPFGKQLNNDAGGFGAERGTNGELPAPGCGARQQQVGDIGTGNQQNEPDRAEQNSGVRMSPTRSSLIGT